MGLGVVSDVAQVGGVIGDTLDPTQFAAEAARLDAAKASLRKALSASSMAVEDIEANVTRWANEAEAFSKRSGRLQNPSDILEGTTQFVRKIGTDRATDLTALAVDYAAAENESVTEAAKSLVESLKVGNESLGIPKGTSVDDLERILSSYSGTSVAEGESAAGRLAQYARAREDVMNSSYTPLGWARGLANYGAQAIGVAAGTAARWWSGADKPITSTERQDAARDESIAKAEGRAAELEKRRASLQEGLNYYESASSDALDPRRVDPVVAKRIVADSNRQAAVLRERAQEVDSALKEAHERFEEAQGRQLDSSKGSVPAPVKKKEFIPPRKPAPIEVPITTPALFELRDEPSVGTPLDVVPPIIPEGVSVSDNVSQAMRRSLAPTGWERMQAYYDERHTPDKEPPRELTARDKALAGLATGGVNGVAGSVLQGGMAAGPAGAIMAMISASEGFAKVMEPINGLLQKAANVIGAVFEPFAALFEELSAALTPTLEALRPIVATLMELSPWFQFLKIQVEILGQVMKGVAGFLTDGVLAFLQFLKKGLSGMGISWGALNKAISALKNPIDGLSEAFRSITANIPSDYDLLNLRIFQAGGMEAASVADDAMREALNRVASALETLADWIYALIKVIGEIFNLGGIIGEILGGIFDDVTDFASDLADGAAGVAEDVGDAIAGAFGQGATSSEASGSGITSGQGSVVAIYGAVHVHGVQDPEDLVRKLQRVGERRDTVLGGGPRFRRLGRSS